MLIRINKNKEKWMIQESAHVFYTTAQQTD